MYLVLKVRCSTLLTFGVLLWFFKTNPERFQTGWFLESVATEILILLVIRTQRPFLKSKPGKYLLYAVLFVGMVTIMLPYLPYADFLGLSPLPWPMVLGWFPLRCYMRWLQS